MQIKCYFIQVMYSLVNAGEMWIHRVQMLKKTGVMMEALTKPACVWL